MFISTLQTNCWPRRRSTRVSARSWTERSPNWLAIKSRSLLVISSHGGVSSTSSRTDIRFVRLRNIHIMLFISQLVLHHRHHHQRARANTHTHARIPLLILGIHGVWRLSLNHNTLNFAIYISSVRLSVCPFLHYWSFLFCFSSNWRVLRG